MRIHNSLPSYYNGLTYETVRNGLPAAQFSSAQQIKKIPTLIEPTETQDRYTLSLDVSGVNPNDIAVVVDGNQLLIEIEKEFDPFKLAHTNWDKCYGLFKRTFELPENCDKKQINFRSENGALSIEIFKTDLARTAPAPKATTQSPPELTL